MINVHGSSAEYHDFDSPRHNDIDKQERVAIAFSQKEHMNPTCAGRDDDPAGPADPGEGTFSSLLRPVGVTLGPSVFALRGESLSPETADQWSVGFNWAPRPDDPYVGMLSGFELDVSYWHIQRENLIGNINAGAGINDPASFEASQTSLSSADPFASRWIAAPRPDLLLSAPENASFKAVVDALIATGKAAFDPNAIPFIKFITIGSICNRGWNEIAGIDFSARYDWDWGNWGAFNVRVSGYYETRNRSQALGSNPISSSYTQVDRDTGLVRGANSGHQMQRMRFNLGWTDGFFSIVSGATWVPHGFGGGTPPACFWHEDFGPGSCYAGSPYYPSPALPPTPAGHEPVLNQRFAGQFQPSQMFFDLAFAYNTGDMPTNSYLQNMRFGLNINNVLNRLPSAIDYDPRTSSGSPRIREGNDFQRTVAFTVTKTW
jgi:hypothetical protein